MDESACNTVWESLKSAYEGLKNVGGGMMGGMMNVMASAAGQDLPDIDMDLEDYILGLGVAAIFLYIAGKEAEFRANPMGSANAMVQKIFGKYSAQAPGNNVEAVGQAPAAQPAYAAAQPAAQREESPTPPLQHPSYANQ